MRLTKLALSTASAALVLAVAASSASATQIHSGSATGPLYTGPTTATLAAGTTANFTSGFVNITCNQSTIAGTITNSNGTGTIDSASWTNNGGNCPNNIGGTCASTALNLKWNANANFDSAHSGGRDGYMVIGSGGNQMRVKADCTDGFGTHTICYYTGNNASNDGANTQRGDIFNGSPGQQKFPSVSDTKNNLLLDTTQKNGFLCSSTAKYAATYDVVGSGGVSLWITA